AAHADAVPPRHRARARRHPLGRRRRPPRAGHPPLRPARRSRAHARGDRRRPPALLDRVHPMMLVLLLLLAAPAAAEPFADRVVGYTIGTAGAAREADLPGVALAGPRAPGASQGSMDPSSPGSAGSIAPGSP